MRFSDPKRLLPWLVALVAGGIALASYVIPNPVSDALLNIAALLTSAGLLIGILNVINTHRERIASGSTGWPYSLVLIIALITTFVLGVLPSVAGGVEFFAAITGAVFQYVYQPLAGSVLALLTFFALRAVWRALQLRPAEASIIVGVAIVFLLASGPWAELVPGLSATLAWIQAYPVLGVARGLLLGIGIGALVASVRLLLGLDQPYLDR